jgi:hypothetical protein
VPGAAGYLVATLWLVTDWLQIFENGAIRLASPRVSTVTAPGRASGHLHS